MRQPAKYRLVVTVPLIAEEFVAMQVDLEIPMVISILRELDVYKREKDGEQETTLINHKM